jgi:hypothetical protein
MARSGLPQTKLQSLPAENCSTFSHNRDAISPQFSRYSIGVNERRNWFPTRQNDEAQNQDRISLRRTAGLALHDSGIAHCIPAGNEAMA